MCWGKSLRLDRECVARQEIEGRIQHGGYHKGSEILDGRIRWLAAIDPVSDPTRVAADIAAAGDVEIVQTHRSTRTCAIRAGASKSASPKVTAPGRSKGKRACVVDEKRRRENKLITLAAATHIDPKAKVIDVDAAGRDIKVHIVI